MAGNARLGEKCAALGMMPLGDATSCDGGGTNVSVELTPQIISVASQQAMPEWAFSQSVTTQIIHVAGQQAQPEYDVTVGLPTEQVAVSSGNPEPIVSVEVTLGTEVLSVQDLQASEAEVTINQEFTLSTQIISIQEHTADSLFDVAVTLPTEQIAVSSGNPNPEITVAYDVTVNLNTQHVSVKAENLDPLVLDIVCHLPAQEVNVIANGSDPLLDIAVEVSTQEIAITPAVVGGVVTPSNTKFVETMRSAACQVLLGVSGNPFKLNPAAATVRRSGRAHNLHTGRTVKPVVVMMEAEFDVVTPTSQLAAGEFLYKRDDGYLQITNVDPINVTLVADDVDSDAILVEPKTIEPNSFSVFSSFQTNRHFHPSL